MLHRIEDDQKRKKSIALKADMEIIEGSEDEHSFDNNIQDEDLAMIVRKIRRFMGRKKRFSQRFSKKGEINRDKKKEKEK